ncbi:MAG: bifunctional DNA-formamidopyrimidine glycosylase/DNA-(apurinic or apyrimidinic site) lyase [Planctomycetes bacterium]|nr:bifunctional DNA-formamidopyrimidine glycosylase/DNA-(apurinic or apyrimidinic site) lyase [Planctomycetota bacterium]
MPELPEVETMRRGLTPLVGRKVLGVERPRCRCRPISIMPRWATLRRRMVGRTISAVSRLGKRVVIELDEGGRLVIEPRMTGLVLLAAPPSLEHLRLRIIVSGGPELLFWDRRGLGTVRLFAADEFAAEFDRRIGPDALSLTPEMSRQRLSGSRREIKVALLDQKAIAGIGNLYASEILHLARIHPRQRCDQLCRSQWPRLHAAIREVLEAAIRHEGSTLSDGTYRNALNQNGGYQNHHRVYDRAGEVCTSCGRGTIVRIVQAQRSTFYCTKCQKL